VGVGDLGLEELLPGELGLPIAGEKKTTNFQLTDVQKVVSKTMVIEKPQEVRVRPHDFAGSSFSITILECDFSNPALGDGFREEKTRWNRASDQVCCFFLRCYRKPFSGKIAASAPAGS